MTQLPLTLPATDTFADWSSLGRRLCTGARQMNWLIGDWLIEGSTKYGEDARDEANRIFRQDVERFDPILRTCRRFPEPKRHPALTFGHHAAVMAVQDDDEAETLLSVAETERLTTAQLKAKVRVSHSQPAFLPDDDPEDAGYRAIIQAANRCGSREARRLAVESIIEAGYGVVDL